MDEGDRNTISDEVQILTRHQFRDEPKDKEGVGSVPTIVRESSHHRTFFIDNLGS